MTAPGDWNSFSKACIRDTGFDSNRSGGSAAVSALYATRKLHTYSGHRHHNLKMKQTAVLLALRSLF